MVKPPACANVFATYRVRNSVCTNALPVRALSGDWVGAYAGFTLADKTRIYRARVARVRALVALAACDSVFFDEFQMWGFLRVRCEPRSVTAHTMGFIVGFGAREETLTTQRTPQVFFFVCALRLYQSGCVVGCVVSRRARTLLVFPQRQIPPAHDRTPHPSDGKALNLT